MRTPAALILSAAVTSLAFATGSAQNRDSRPGEIGASSRCAASSLGRNLPNATTVVNSAALNPASAAQPARGRGGATPALLEHCEVAGRMNERQGADGQRYAINFRLWLPTDWNGRFFFQGGGGSNGAVGNALGALQGQQASVALALGYAVVSQDSGHDNQTNSVPGPISSGCSPSPA